MQKDHVRWIHAHAAACPQCGGKGRLYGDNARRQLRACAACAHRWTVTAIGQEVRDSITGRATLQPLS